MSNGEERRACADCGKATAGATVKLQLRWSSASYHLNVDPKHLLSMTGSERLHRRFLRREPAGKMDGRESAALTIGDFAVGENSTEKTVTKTFDCRFDAGDVRGIEAKANDVRHEGNHTSDTRR